MTLAIIGLIITIFICIVFFIIISKMNKNKNPQTKDINNVQNQITELNEMGIINDKDYKLLNDLLQNALNNFKKEQQKYIDKKIDEKINKNLKTIYNDWEYHTIQTNKDKFTKEFIQQKTLYISNNIKNLNYYFQYKITKEYSLHQSNFIMINPMFESEYFNKLKFNIDRFIPQPNTYRSFLPKSIIEFNYDFTADHIGFFVDTDNNYNITITCYITKAFEKILKEYKIPEIKKVKNKIISNIFTEMRQIIIQCYEELKEIQNPEIKIEN